MVKSQRGFSLIELLLVTAVLAILASMTVPDLVRSKRATNEASAISSARSLVTAQITYASTRGSGNFATLSELQNARLVDNVLGGGTKDGYIFTVTPVGNTNFTIVAVPVAAGTTGWRGFFADATGVIRFTLDGSAPNSSSTPLSGS